MAVGRPITLTDRVALKQLTVTATSGQTSFSPSGGYAINEIAVYQNGVKLVQNQDFIADDGATVVLTEGATEGDVVAFQIFDSFTVANVIKPNEADQTINGNLSLTGGITVTGQITGDVTGDVIGNVTGNATGLSGNPSVNTTGVITATTFVGDLTGNVTGSATTAAVPGISTQLHSTFGTVVVGGASTFTGAIDANSTSNFGGVVTISDATTSTSAGTGALVVTGGVGIGKSLFVTEGISVGGTITYDDVTNIDSVGIVTAGKGFSATTQGLNVVAGVVTTPGLHVTGIATVGTALSVYPDNVSFYGLLREKVNISASALNSATAINLDEGMTHYRSSAVGAANVKINVISGTGINTDLSIGDAIALNVITVAGNTAHFVDQIRIDGVVGSAGVTTHWVGGSAPTDGGGSGVDTYAFNILKTANAAYVVVANHIKTS